MRQRDYCRIDSCCISQIILFIYQDKNGVIDVTDISDKYDATKHPDVISGRKIRE